jgi:uncharacterized membrane protein
MESLYIVLRETIEYSVIVLLLAGIYKEQKKVLFTSAVLVVLAGVLMTWMNYPLSGFLAKAYTGMMFYSFMMILLLSFVSGEAIIYPLICIVLSLLLPSAQVSAVIAGEISLKGWHVILYSFVGAMAGLLVFIPGIRILSRFDLRNYFGTDGIMVFIAAFCFLFGGLNEFDTTSIITALQKGFYTFNSSLIISLKELLLVPHGGVLTLAADDTLAYISSERFAMAVTALVLSTPPVYVFIKLLSTPEPTAEGVEIKAAKRKILAVYTDDLINKGTPLLISLLASIVLLHFANLAMNPKYDPEPVPVVNDGETVMIPLTGKLGDISDGRIRKYSVRHEENVYVLIVIMRPDAKIVASLDACEICPEHGYVQRGEHVICKYCGTPIPLQSLGQPGGCNPIPVKSRTEGNTLILKKSDIVSTFNKWIGGS